MGFNVGDSVQIKAGGIDVTNGKKAKAGRLYGEGGPYWATIEKIVPGWATGSRWGLPATVTKYRCWNRGIVVWQVQEKDLVGKTNTEESAAAPVEEKGTDPLVNDFNTGTNYSDNDIEANGTPYAPEKDSSIWTGGEESIYLPDTDISKPKDIDTPYISDSMFSSDASRQTPDYLSAELMFRSASGELIPVDVVSRKVAGVRLTKEDIKKTITKYTSRRTWIPAAPWRAKYLTNMDKYGRVAELKNEEYTNGKLQKSSRLQNSENFPRVESLKALNNMDIAEYNYQIIPGDKNYSITKTLEDKLKQVRRAYGLMVHGDNDIARSVKFYMYNRYKVPDTNLAHNKTVTHIFFTRPDLNIISSDVGTKLPNNQVLNHSESALIWRRYPEIFKLLTDCRRCKDNNNFNMLLSNQITSFSLLDESLDMIRAGRSWREHEIVYGQNYTGRTAGEFSCTFTETSEFSILNLIKMWMTYIDNISTGVWSPNYSGGEYNHAAHRALDYAASMYVFKCGPDGEDVLYWSKYYGVFPVANGASALSWERSSSTGNAPSLNINFAYSMKRDMNPISLLEFNHNAMIDSSRLSKGWEAAWTLEQAGSSLPFVETPYIEISLTNPSFASANQVYKGQRTSIRLKYISDTSSQRDTDVLYKSHHGLSN
jgi:hypothetical protein